MQTTQQLSIPFSNFTSFRNQQEEAIKTILASEKPVIALRAECGTGKSLIGMMATHLKTIHSLYICTTKSLQNQLLSDFPEAVTMKGRNNFICNLHNNRRKEQDQDRPFAGFDIMADECEEKCELVEEDMCCYYNAKKATVHSRYAILNLSYYLYEANYAKMFSGYEFVVIDEADTLERATIDFITLEINENTINKYGLGMPRYKTKHESWKDWARDSIEVLKDIKNKQLARQGKIKGKLMSSDKDKKKDIKELDKLKKELKQIDSLKDSLVRFINYVDETWIYKQQRHKHIFSPVYLKDNLTSDHLTRHGEQFLLMSATLPPKPILALNLGISIDDLDYIELDSPFDPDRMPVYYQPKINMCGGFDEGKASYMASEILDVLERDKYKDCKGIIQGVSYRLTHVIVETINGAFGWHKAMTHDSKTKQEVVDQFLSLDDPVVLVSPSIERGLDLKGDLGRFCIIPKVPFPSLGDDRIRQRKHTKPHGHRWYMSETAQIIEQMRGRVMRSADDWGDTIILDAAFDGLIEYMSDSFRGCIVCDI